MDIQSQVSLHVLMLLKFFISTLLGLYDYNWCLSSIKKMSNSRVPHALVAIFKMKENIFFFLDKYFEFDKTNKKKIGNFPP